MTREEFTKQLPKITYNPLEVKPPLFFNGVSARVFPLRASLDTLQQLVDSLLNIVPPEAGYYRVPFPYVELVVLDYGRMTEKMMRTGWFSQVEVYFGVFLEWYKRINGRYVFHDWATITPYIFVNDDFSAPTGRMVYGFSKVIAKVEQTQSPWMKKPVAPVILARISTTVFPHAYEGGNLENKAFLEIEQRPVSNLHTAFDSTSPTMPWTIAANLANAAAGFARDATWLAQSMRIFPLSPWADPGLLQQMAGAIPAGFAPGGRGFITNSLNLKQFRRSSDPTKICYQSLTNGQMSTTGFNGAGLLGEECTLAGDVSGGFSIKLYDHSSLPIVRTLGLEVQHTESGAGEGAGMARLKPVLPFWTDVDLKYDAGTNLAWRTDNGVWKNEAGEPFDAPHHREPDFNNQVSTAIEAISGPFEFNGTTIRVIPLRAKQETLETFLEKYINGPLANSPIKDEHGKEEHVRFEVWARPPQAINEHQFADKHPIGGGVAYVYLTASSFDSVTSDTNNVGNWAKYELSFMIPVKWRRKDEKGDWQTMGVGLIPAVTFADNCITAISRTEIQGIPASTAQFDRPESVWLTDEPESKKAQTLLRVKAEVISAMGAGQKGTVRPVIEITRPAAKAAGDQFSWKWAAELRRELQTKKASKLEHWEQLKVSRALSLELLGNEIPFALYSMKQFPDVTDPGKACYQAVVRVPRRLREVLDLREIEETLEVRIYDYPSLDIVKQLGLRTIRMEDSGAGIVHNTQAVRPFYIRATMSEDLGERLLSRSGTSGWKIEPAAFKTMLSHEKGATPITADMLAEQVQDQNDPRCTAETMFSAKQRKEQRDASNTGDAVITVERARGAFDITDPQIVIESILSREWSNNDPNARWLQGRKQMEDGFNALSQGGPLKPLAEAELYRLTNNGMAMRPGAVAAMIKLDDMETAAAPAPPSSIPGVPSAGKIVEVAVELVENLAGDGPSVRWVNTIVPIVRNERRFTELRLEMEDCLNVLSPVAIAGIDVVRRSAQFLDSLDTGQPAKPLEIPSIQELLTKGTQLISVIKGIQQMQVVGEPNKDLETFAVDQRLGQWLRILTDALSDAEKLGGSPEGILQLAQAHTTELGQVVNLARSYCGMQYQALLNKLARAFQKPDFCIPRDCVSPADCDSLLPLALSWDENWYSGGNLRLVDPRPDAGSQPPKAGNGAAPPQSAPPPPSTTAQP